MFDGLTLNQLGQSKIRDPDLVMQIHQNVGGLHIAMHNLSIVRVLQSSEQVGGNVLGIVD